VKNLDQKPGLMMAVLPIVVTMALLLYLVVLKGGAPHIAIIVGLAITAIIGRIRGYRWESMQKAMVRAATVTLPVIGILMAIGMLVGSWIVSGTVPLLMLYGLDLVNPGFFLPSVCIGCSLISLATGTSWGTLGTIGIAFMGIGEGLGIPSYLTAGAVVSGAFFGDKVSPLSDSTNFCANIVGANLYKHIVQLLPSTLPAMIIGLVLYWYLGQEFAGREFANTNSEEAITALNVAFNIHTILLIPPLIVITAAIIKMPPIPSLFAGIFAAVVLAIFVQNESAEVILHTVMYGYTSDTGIEFVDTLLSKGGLNSMLWISGLMILTVSFGGLLEKTRSIEVMVESLQRFVRGIGSAVLSATLTMLLMTFTTDLYIAYTVSARIFCPMFRGWGRSTTNVSRVLENSGTMITPLVPWGAAGVYVTGMLGVPTIMYAPFSFACWLAPVFDMIWGFTGFFIPGATDQEKEVWRLEDRKFASNGRLMRASQCAST
jgi:NhaC family Na+:H+ antiporter